MADERSRVRPQYHFRPTPAGVLIWDVRKLIELSRGFPRKWVALSDIRELDEVYWGAAGGEGEPTCRDFALHAKLIQACDLAHPIILSSDGRVMDGMHRVCKAWVEDRERIECVQFEVDPEPDYRDKRADELPYEW